MRKAARHFEWTGRIETLEDRRVMSADPLLGGTIEHHAFEESDAPQIEHQLVSEPDFWLDVDNLLSLEDQLDQIEQTLYSAHTTTGLNTVVANYGFTGVGQTVAVIDSGIAYDHFALGGGFGANYKVVGGWDFTGENDANPYDDGPSGSHGTHVAGIVGGTSGPDSGVAPGVDLVALRVFDDSGAGYFSWVENALQWVISNRTSFENPITAINLSLGVSSWNSNTVPSWSTLEDEFATLKAAGVFIAVSAGNAFTSYNQPGLSYPAASPNVVPVMSVTDGGALASYSQRAVNAIAAPGSAIRSTVPDYKGNNNGITDDYANFSGTSMASPYIAGASVLIRQAMEFAGYTNITQDTIYNHMMATGTSFVDSVTGLTFKRLNLGAAINALMPADEFGSTVATAYSLGTLSSSQSLAGTIGTVSDIDYFTFTATTNGQATFEVSDATHNMDAAWTLSNGTGTLSNNGDTFTFDVVAGQSYTVGLSSSGGIGHYSLDASVESTFSYTDWGAVTYSQLNGLSVNQEAWYRVTASKTGYLTAEGLYTPQNGQVSLQLYNSNMQVLVSGNSANGTSRVDAYANAGQQFYIRVIGTNSNVNYRLSNLVSVDGTTVNITGTSGDDTFAFTAGTTHTITVNGVTHAFSAIAVNAFNFNGGSGNDTIVMTGTAGIETATMRVGTASLAGTGYTVATVSIENATVFGGGGDDVANIYDSSAADRFTASPTFAAMRAEDYAYMNQIYSFKRVLAFSSTGIDTAWLYDSAGADRFVASPTFGIMRAEDNSYYNETNGFDRVTAIASTGFDIATLSGSAAPDRFVASSTYAVMRAADSTYYNEANGFDSVVATGGAGVDQALLYGSGGDDRFVASPSFGVLRAVNNSFYNEANGFESVTAFGSGGADQAVLYDSAGADRFVASPAFGVLRALDNSYYNEANGFGLVTAIARSGQDEAILYDSAGADRFVASPTFGVLRAIDYSFANEANGFDRVTAISRGGLDQAVLYDSTGADRLTGAATYTALQSQAPGYYVEANGFKDVTAYSTAGGNDHAEFRDSNLDEMIYGRGSDARLSGTAFSVLARSFESVSAVSEGQMGIDVLDVLSVDYVFSQVGAWS